MASDEEPPTDPEAPAPPAPKAQADTAEPVVLAPDGKWMDAITGSASPPSDGVALSENDDTRAPDDE
jgi:hypothetical protein